MLEYYLLITYLIGAGYSIGLVNDGYLFKSIIALIFSPAIMPMLIGDATYKIIKQG